MKDFSHARPVQILLVEDSPADVRLTIEALKEAKISNQLSVASDGVEAMSFLRQEGRTPRPRPDLILLDLNLPRKDGRQVLEEIKEDAGLRRIPVVVLTVSQAEEDVLRAYDLHANCYITKPVDFERFMEVVRQIEGFWLTWSSCRPTGELTCQVRKSGCYHAATRILLVEDNLPEARLIAELLQDSGEPFEVAHCESLAEAEEQPCAAGRRRPCCWTSRLPDSLGLATLERVLAAAPAIPILVLTGLAGRADSPPRPSARAPRTT